MFTSFHTKISNVFSLMKSKSSFDRLREQRESIFLLSGRTLSANIIIRVLKLQQLFVETARVKPASLDILISVLAKWCIYLDQTSNSQNVCCADRVSSIETLRGQCY